MDSSKIRDKSKGISIIESLVCIVIIGIGFIPVFAMMIMDPTIIQTKLPNYINLKFHFKLKVHHI